MGVHGEGMRGPLQTDRAPVKSRLACDMASYTRHESSSQTCDASVQASNCSSAPVDLQTSLACVPHDALPDAEEERDEASVMFCGATSGELAAASLSGTLRPCMDLCLATALFGHCAAEMYHLVSSRFAAVRSGSAATFTVVVLLQYCRASLQH